MLNSAKSRLTPTDPPQAAEGRPEVRISGSPERSDRIRLRDATLADAEAVAEIYNASIAAGGACLQDALLSPAEIRGWIENFDDREVILVLEESPGPGEPAAEASRDPTPTRGTLQGWGIIKRYSERRGYRFTCETAVYLRRDQTGRGLGSRIKKALMARCQELGYHHMVAKILAVNRASIEYNRKLGYEIVGVQKEVGFQDGQWQDVVILQKILDRPLPSETDDR